MAFIISSAGQQFSSGGSGGGGGTATGLDLQQDGNANGFRIENLGDPINPGDAVNLQTLGAAIAGVSGDFVRRDGATPMSADWDFGGYRLANLSGPTSGADAVNLDFMNAAIAAAVGGISGFVRADGTTPMTADWNFGGFPLTNVASLGVGTPSPGASALVQLDSTTRGFLAPRMTSSQRDAIAGPAEGLLIYDVTDGIGFQYYNGVAWVSLGSNVGDFVRVDGTTPLTGDWDVGGYRLTDLADPASDSDAVNRGSMNAAIAAISGFVRTNGTTPLTADWNVGGFDVTNLDQLGVGTAAPGASAAVQIDSTARGFLGPRVTTTQRDAIVSPATGLLVYNTTTGQYEYYTGAAWASVGLAISGAVTGALTYYNGASWVALAPGGAGSTLASGGPSSAPTWTTFSVGATSHFVARAVSTLPIGSLSGTTTIDGVSLAAGDLVMLVAQASGTSNGPWVVQAGAWIRPPGFTNGSIVPNGHVCYVQLGTLGARTGWRCTTASTITVGTTTLTYDGVIGWGTMSAADTDELITWLRGGTQRLQVLTSNSSGDILLGNNTSLSTIRSATDIRLCSAGDTSATQSQFLINASSLAYRIGSGNSARLAFGISATETYLGQHENSNLGAPVMIPFRGSQPFSTSVDTSGAGLRFRAGLGRGNAADAGVTLGGSIVTGTSSGTTLQTGRDSFNARGEYCTELGGWRLRRTATATDYTVLVTDHLIAVTNTGAVRTITLPAAAGVAGMDVLVKDESGGAGTNNINVVASGGGNIDASATYSITANYGKVRLYSNGTQWFTLATS